MRAEETLKRVRKVRVWKTAYQNEVTKLLHLHASLEGQLQLASLDNDVREVKKMYLKGI